MRPTVVNSLSKNPVRQLPIFIFDNTQSLWSVHRVAARASIFSLRSADSKWQAWFTSQIFLLQTHTISTHVFPSARTGRSLKKNRGCPNPKVLTSPREGPLLTLVYTAAVFDGRPVLDDEFIIRTRKNVIAYGFRLSPIIFFTQIPRRVFYGRRNPPADCIISFESIFYLRVDLCVVRVFQYP